MKRIRYALSMASLLLTFGIGAHAQSLPNDLQPIAPDQIPLTGYGGVYSIAHYPQWPPLPGLSGIFDGDQLYFSQSLNSVFVDDRARIMSQMLIAAADDPPSPGDGSGDTNAIPLIQYSPPYNLSTNYSNLYLEMVSASSDPQGEANLILHNTTHLTPYLLVTTDNLTNTVLDSWNPEQVVIGAEGTNTLASVFIKDRTNQLFFSARPLPSANLAAVATLDSSLTSANAYVNGGSTPVTVTAFTNNFVGFTPPLYSLNMGYGGDDRMGVLYNPLEDPYSHLPQQNVTGLAFEPGMMTAFTNLCLSSNHVTSLDVHSLPALKDIECFRCTNLAYVNVTNCPSLVRACFEQCAIQGVLNFDGNTNLIDIRGAVNKYTNVIVGSSGPTIQHFCTRDNPQLGKLVLTNLYSVRELWAFNCNQSGALTRDAMPSTALESVQLYSNRFEYADFTGNHNLETLWIANNALTNLVLSDCPFLWDVDAHGNNFASGAMDYILTTLTNVSRFGGSLNLSYNPELPSAVGYAALNYLTNVLHWRVTLDAGGDGTPGGTNAVTFVTMGNGGYSTAHLQVEVNDGATVTWHWSDGSTYTGTQPSTHAFYDGNVRPHTNYVTIDPPDKLTSFGTYTQWGDAHITSVSGLANFTNLSGLWLWNTGLVDADLTGCSKLNDVRLAGNPETQTMTDNWFYQLAACTTVTGTFHYNSPNPGCWANQNGITNSPSADATNSLIAKGWSMDAWGCD